MENNEGHESFASDSPVVESLKRISKLKSKRNQLIVVVKQNTGNLYDKKLETLRSSIHEL